MVQSVGIQYWGGKMAETQIKSMSITHEAILDWLLLNPRESQGDCAAFFGVTESWLSVIVNSDCFQARLLERRMARDESFRSLLETKMQSVVNTGLDRIGEKLKFEPDLEKLLSTTDKLLGRLGYGPKQGPAVGGSVNVQTNFVISADELRRAATHLSIAPPAVQIGTAPSEAAVPTAQAEHAPQNPDELEGPPPSYVASHYSLSEDWKDYAASSVDGANHAPTEKT